jgi:hypothetical protein
MTGRQKGHGLGAKRTHVREHRHERSHKGRQFLTQQRSCCSHRPGCVAGPIPMSNSLTTTRLPPNFTANAEPCVAFSADTGKLQQKPGKSKAQSDCDHRSFKCFVTFRVVCLRCQWPLSPARMPRLRCWPVVCFYPFRPRWVQLRCIFFLVSKAKTETNAQRRLPASDVRWKGSTFEQSFFPGV